MNEVLSNPPKAGNTFLFFTRWLVIILFCNMSDSPYTGGNRLQEVDSLLLICNQIQIKWLHKSYITVRICWVDLSIFLSNTGDHNKEAGNAGPCYTVHLRCD